MVNYNGKNLAEVNDPNTALTPAEETLTNNKVLTFLSTGKVAVSYETAKVLLMTDGADDIIVALVYNIHPNKRLCTNASGNLTWK